MQKEQCGEALSQSSHRLSLLEGSKKADRANASVIDGISNSEDDEVSSSKLENLPNSRTSRISTMIFSSFLTVVSVTLTFVLVYFDFSIDSF